MVNIFSHCHNKITL